MRRAAGTIIAAASLLASAGTADATTAPLRSPWDGPVATHASASVTCPPPPVVPHSIVLSNFYTDKAHSIADPERYDAYRAAAKPFNEAAKALAAMADDYRVHGNPATAQCVATWLASFAKSGALTGLASTNQATYVQGWTLGGFAADWLKVRMAPGIAAEARASVPAWLGDVAMPVRDYFAARADKVDGRNNHRYWAGFAVMAAGIAAGRRGEFDWGVDAFRIGARQIDADGVLPLEMDRRAKALHYHLFAATPLVAIAELAGANGLDLYKENGGALHRLGARALAGVADPGFYAKRAGIAQEPVKRSADSLAWAIPFERHYPDAEVKALVTALPSTAVLYLGGDPPP